MRNARPIHRLHHSNSVLNSVGAIPNRCGHWRVNQRKEIKMKHILLPIHSQWVRLFLNGIKEIEVRSGTKLYKAINRLIDEQGCAPCLMYVTKAEPYLRRYPFSLDEAFYQLTDDSFNALNGRVVAKFNARAERIMFGTTMSNDLGYFCDYTSSDELMKKSCLAKEDMRNDLKVENNGVCGTAIKVEKGSLKIFDKPKKLTDYGVKRSPQSYMFIEVEE